MLRILFIAMLAIESTVHAKDLDTLPPGVYEFSQFLAPEGAQAIAVTNPVIVTFNDVDFIGGNVDPDLGNPIYRKANAGKPVLIRFDTISRIQRLD